LVTVIVILFDEIQQLVPWYIPTKYFLCRYVGIEGMALMSVFAVILHNNNE
jgi:hypothetical protein